MTKPDLGHGPVQGWGLNAFWNGAGLLLPGVAGLAAIPVLLRGLGAADFAVFSLTLLGLAWAPVTDLGLSRSVTLFVARLSGSRSPGDGPVIWTAFALALGIGSALGASVLLIVHRSTILAALLPSERLDEASWAIAAVAFCLPVLVAGPVFRGALEGRQRFGLVNGVKAATNTLAVAVPSVLALLGFGLREAIVTLLVARCLSGPLYAAAVLRLMPTARRVAFSPDLIGPLLSNGLAMAITALAGGLLSMADRVAVGWATDAVTMGWYSAMADMAGWLRVPASSTAVAAFPLLAHESVTSSGGSAAAAVVTQRATSIALFTLAAPMLGGAAFLLSVVLGIPITPVVWGTFLLVALGAIGQFHAYIPIATLEGLGDPWTPARVFLVEAVAIGGLLFFVGSFAGAVGVAAVVALRGLVEGIFFDRIAWGYLGKACGRVHYARAFASLLLWSLMASFAGLGLAVASPWSGLIVMIGAFTGAVLLSFQVGMDRGERMVFLERSRSLFRQIRGVQTGFRSSRPRH